MISVTLVDANVYEAVVGERVHRVYMAPDCYRRLSGGAFTHEWVIVQAIQFLLEREPGDALAAELDLTDLSRRFPDFDAEVERRLHRR